MRDERNLQSPPSSKEAMEAESAYVAARTAALLFFHASGAVSIGSATGIQLGSHYFLATTSHNINARDQSSRLDVIPYGTSTQKVTIISRSHPRATEYDHDVAWLQVEPEVAEASGIAWLSIKDLLCGQRFDPHRAFLIQGFPASEVVIRGPRGFDSLSLGIGCISLPPDPGDDFLTLEYPPQSTEDVGIDWPPPQGLIDGGGIWRLSAFRESLIWVPETPLVAIGRSYAPERVRLTTTPIEYWLSLVAKDFPDLREEIDSHLQASRPTPTVFISPHFGYPKLQNPSIDDLVDVLEDRIKSWVLEPARKLASGPVEQYAALSLMLSYFEGIWIYIQGKDSKNRSQEFFEAAFVEVFLSGSLNERMLKRLAEVLYKDARCGFFHDGMFRDRIFIGKPKGGVMHVTLPRIDGVIDGNGIIESVFIDVEEFYRYVDGHFRKLVARLRDSSQVDLRSNFHKMCREKWKYEGEPRVIALSP
jgi:hypothetical protein